MPKTLSKKSIIKVSSCNNNRPCYLTQREIQRTVHDLVLGKPKFQISEMPFRSTQNGACNPHTYVYFLDWQSFSQYLCPKETAQPVFRLTITVKQGVSQHLLRPCYEHFSFERGEQSWLFVRRIVEKNFEAILKYVRGQYTPLIDAVSLYQSRRDPFTALPLGTVIAHDIMECLTQILGMQNAGFKMFCRSYEDSLTNMLSFNHPLGLLEDGQTLLVLSK